MKGKKIIKNNKRINSQIIFLFDCKMIFKILCRCGLFCNWLQFNCAVFPSFLVLFDWVWSVAVNFIVWVARLQYWSLTTYLLCHSNFRANVFPASSMIWFSSLLSELSDLENLKINKTKKLHYLVTIHSSATNRH